MGRKSKPISREKQANREALLTLGAYSLYFVWWYAFAYGLGDGDPEEYNYVLGIPAWFFYSCIVGYVVLSLVLWLMIRFFFRDISLDPEEPDASGSGRDGGTPAEQPEITVERHPEVL